MLQTTSSPPSRSSPRTDSVRIVAVADDGRRVEVDGLAELERVVADHACRFWVDLTAPEPATLERTAQILGIHPLVVEDILERNERAKVVRLDGMLHLVLFAVRHEQRVLESEIDFVLTERWLLTVHERDWEPRQAPRLRDGAEPVLAEGPDSLLHAFADWIVDGYFPVLDRLTDEIDQLQDEIVGRRSPETLERLFDLKRELIHLRRATGPAREMFNQLTNRELGLIRPERVIYFRDVYDHLIRVTDDLDTYREMLAGTLEVYLSSVNNELSLVMKRLTGVTVILAGIGAVAGLFGMSEAGPALLGREAGGFWMIVAVTLAVAAIVALILRRIDWI